MENFLLLIALAINAFENPYLFGALLVATALIVALIRRSYGLELFLSVGLTFATTHIIKSIYAIARPDDAIVIVDGYRFPSGHASLSAALVVSMMWPLLERTTRPLIRVGILGAGGALIAFIAWTRLILGVHHLVDVSVGVVIGGAIATGIHLLGKKYKIE